MLYGFKKYNDIKYNEAHFVDYRDEEDIKNKTKIAFLDWEEMNRIQDSIFYVYKIMEKCGYDSVSVTFKRNWEVSDDYTLDYIIQFANKLKLLKKSYFEKEINIEELFPANNKLNYKNVNKWEHIAKELEKKMQKIAHQWRYSGEAITGEGGGLLGI